MKHHKPARRVRALTSLFWATACLGAVAQPDMTPKDATPATVAVQRQTLNTLPFADKQDFEDANRGFIATLPGAEVKNAQGRAVWNLAPFAKFLDPDVAPPTVNPNLWRQARLNQIHGLFKVTDRVYQVRNFDMSNMTIIEGDSGLILIDPLISAETAKAALELYLQHRPKKPVVAVIYTHSHVDHFGGVRGVVDEADVKAGKVKIIAPAGFTNAAVEENVIAGNAMSRRAQLQYGIFLPRGVKQAVDIDLGKGVSTGSITLILPSDSISKTMDSVKIDGVDMVFQLTPGTEAPAEMNI